jgi:hypothetical protein
MATMFNFLVAIIICLGLVFGLFGIVGLIFEISEKLQEWIDGAK